MKLKQIKIHDVLGVADLTINADGKTVSINGANGKGKTSILESIRAVLGGGHDAKLLRKGSKQGEVVLVLDDGEIITKTITADKSSLKLDHPEYGKVSKPQQIIDKLIGADALNPVSVLTAKPKDLAALILGAMPLRISPDELAALTGDPAHKAGYAFACQEKHALDVLSECEKAQFEQRTGVNRALKEKRGIIEQLQSAMPAAPEGAADWTAQLEDLSQEQIELASEHTAALGSVERNAKVEKDAAALACAEAVAQITAERDAEIAAIHAKATARISAAGSRKEALWADAGLRSESARATVAAEFGPRVAELAERVGEARAMVDADSKATQTRQIIADMERQADKLNTEADRLTSAIEAIRGRKLALSQSLPIAGMELVDGEVVVDGVAFEKLNESYRIRIAVELATLRMGKLRVVILDGAEKLDSASRELLEHELDEHDVQGIVSRVNDDELTIVTTEAEVPL